MKQIFVLHAHHMSDQTDRASYETSSAFQLDSTCKYPLSIAKCLHVSVQKKSAATTRKQAPECKALLRCVDLAESLVKKNFWLEQTGNIWSLVHLHT